MMTVENELAFAASRLATDARAGNAPVLADLLALLPVLDAVARGAKGDRVERWQRELARMDGLGFNWPRYEALARAAIALADAERAEKVSDISASEAGEGRG